MTGPKATTVKNQERITADLRQVILRNGILSSMILTETIMPDGSIHP